MIVPLLAGFALGVIRERAYQALAKDLEAKRALVHIAKGFATEAILISRFVSKKRRPSSQEYDLNLKTGELVEVKEGESKVSRDFLYDLEE